MPSKGLMPHEKDMCVAIAELPEYKVRMALKFIAGRFSRKNAGSDTEVAVLLAELYLKLGGEVEYN